MLKLRRVATVWLAVFFAVGALALQLTAGGGGAINPGHEGIPEWMHNSTSLPWIPLAAPTLLGAIVSLNSSSRTQDRRFTWTWATALAIVIFGILAVRPHAGLALALLIPVVIGLVVAIHCGRRPTRPVAPMHRYGTSSAA